MLQSVPGLHAHVNASECACTKPTRYPNQVQSRGVALGVSINPLNFPLASGTAEPISHSHRHLEFIKNISLLTV